MLSSTDVSCPEVVLQADDDIVILSSNINAEKYCDCVLSVYKTSFDEMGRPWFRPLISKPRATPRYRFVTKCCVLIRRRYISSIDYNKYSAITSGERVAVLSHLADTVMSRSTNHTMLSGHQPGALYCSSTSVVLIWYWQCIFILCRLQWVRMQKNTFLCEMVRENSWKCGQKIWRTWYYPSYNEPYRWNRSHSITQEENNCLLEQWELTPITLQMINLLKEKKYRTCPSKGLE